MQKLFMRAFSAFHVWVYRLSGGKIMGHFASGAPVCLLTTTGRKSKRPRTVPLLYLGDGERVVLAASQGGSPRHPGWYLNLEAVPEVSVQIGKRSFAARARRASAEEKAALWSGLVATYPPYADYQERTSRDIPVIIVTPV